MPGYAYPVDAVASAGTAKSINFLVTDTAPGSATVIYTATPKTKDILPLVSGDTRVGEDGNPVAIGYNKISNEITLQTGDKLYATCPFEDVIGLTINLEEGVK